MNLDPYRVVAVPGTQQRDRCIVITNDLWRSFHDLSLWVEALCIHEWSLFTERVNNETGIERGVAYALLTDRPDSRRPLSWERNRIDLLLMEGNEFICPWTAKRIRQSAAYDIDHLLPLAVYPTNELWNLVPSDPTFNTHKKRDRLPSVKRIQAAQPHLSRAYDLYSRQSELALALKEDVALRFAGVDAADLDYPWSVSVAVAGFLKRVADSRNLARF